MREHIYKAWSKEKGRWLTLDDRLTIAGESDFWHAWGTGTSSDGTIFLFQDMGAELVKYTGLKDCKRTKKYPEGEMIFEGDKLRTDKEVVFEVFWSNKLARWSARTPNVYHMGYGKEFYKSLTWLSTRGIIVGNKFENPELLEV